MHSWLADGAATKPTGDLIIGPVTTGGKNFMTFSIVNNFISVASITYTKTPQQLLHRKHMGAFLYWGDHSEAVLQLHNLLKRNEEPRNAGALP